MQQRFFLFTLIWLLNGPALGQTVTSIPYLHVNTVCSGRFVTHTLDHITTIPGGETVRMFEANGSGLAINDLDDDGDLEVVLGNHAGLNTILWNEGGLNFRTEHMPGGDTRGVNLVDLNGDGRLDILITRTASGPNYWRNLDNGEFEQEVLPGVTKPFYVMSFGDLENDGDLDIVGGTYDAGLLADRGQAFLESGDAGVYIYYNNNGQYVLNRLAAGAQALALMVVDLNDDGLLDVLVGNDFAVPDYLWLGDEHGWTVPRIFQQTTHSTMSFDFADINNDGLRELFATDMKPYASDDETTTAWEPIIDGLIDVDQDTQINENVLQSLVDDGMYQNEAVARGIDATGWSWSGKFGDLDQDGFLDLVVVNGMAEQSTFSHLDRHELIEENQAFRNDGAGHFERMPAWGLNSMLGGRAMTMADLDLDGDLEVVVNNLRGPSQLFENQLCSGASLQVELRWPASKNTHAIGAKLTLKTNQGQQYRDVRTTAGYLAGEPSRVHFGFPEDTVLHELVIKWPDGEVSLIRELVANHLVTITRD